MKKMNYRAFQLYKKYKIKKREKSMSIFWNYFTQAILYFSVFLFENDAWLKKEQRSCY